MTMQKILTRVPDEDHATTLPTDFTTRTATLDDLDRIMEIEQSSFSLSWSRKEMTLEVEHHSTRFFVALLGTAIIGFAAFRIGDGEAMVSKIAVRHELRGQGYGRALMTRLLCAAQELGLASITLYVRVSNTAALRLYDNLGFYQSRVIERYYYDNHENAIVMTRSLATGNA